MLLDGGRGHGRPQPRDDLLVHAEAHLQVGEPGQDELIDAEPPGGEKLVGHLQEPVDNAGGDQP